MAIHKGEGAGRTRQPAGLGHLNTALRRYFVPRGDRKPSRDAPAAIAPIVKSLGGKAWHILLHGPTTLVDSSRREHAVLSISIPARGYIPDVFVQFEHEVQHLALSDDKAIVQGVMRLLRQRGYEGPDFDRAELGMQRRNSIALEPPAAFRQWVTGRFGWVDLSVDPDPRVERRARLQG
ncbi:MAG: hypothetical protein KIT17_01260 [Rubrivivax sp.]|nr:hypothetical protein [Rubrivivax sp.]